MFCTGWSEEPHSLLRVRVRLPVVGGLHVA